MSPSSCSSIKLVRPKFRCLQSRCRSFLIVRAVFIAAFLIISAQSSLYATTLPDGFVESRIANLSFPTVLAFAPDGRLFVCQQEGLLRVVKNGVLLDTPFLTVDVDNSGERGLVGLAFDPDFTNNHYLYIYYTAKTPTIHNRVSRFTADGDLAVPGSEVPIFDLEDLRTSGSEATEHNGGAMHFGPDGKLYIAVGDNGYALNSQDLATPKGKILRINSDGTIPTDNPFYSSASGNNRAIWARGLRNPFSFDIQPGTGRMFINDVGMASWEEINTGAAGANYGWPDTEGYTSDPRYSSPVYAYAHGSDDMTGCAITGGTFYNPATPQFPNEYVGKYFFIDYCNHWIRTLDPVDNTVSGFATTIGVPNTLALAVGPDGSLYYMTIADASGIGGVFRIQYTDSLAPQIGTQPADQVASVGYSATFSVGVSGYQPLSYQWQKNNVDITGATSSSYTTPAVTLSDDGTQFRCVVSNDFGTATSNNATLSVTTNQPPVGTITMPADGTLWSAGDTINFAGTATDPEDNTLPPSAFTWEVHFQHNTHFHPFMPATSGITSGSFTIPTTNETSDNVWYRIILTVKDSAGLTHTSYRDIFPRKSTISFATNPPGLLVTLDGQPKTTPSSVVGVVGLTRTLGVISPQTINGAVYVFDSWSDGGAATHNISTSASDTTYTANFRDARTGTISASPNPVHVCDGTNLGVTTLTWTTSNLSKIEVHIGSPTGSLFASSGVGTVSKTTGKWVRDGMVFYLQDVTGGKPLTSENTLATVTVNVVIGGCRSGTLTANPNPVQVCDGSGLGTTTLSWTSTGTTAIEVHVGAPNGMLLSSSGPSGSATTGKWVNNNTVFYLQDVSGGLPLTSDNTLATFKATTTSKGCSGLSGSVTANPNPVQVCDGSGFGVTTLTWTSAGTSTVEVHVGSPTGDLMAVSGPGTFSMTTGKWITNGMVFYLQDVSGGLPLNSNNTLATVTVNTTTRCSSGSMSANPNPVQVCDSTGLGTTTLMWSSTGTTTVEVHVGSPGGALFARSGPGTASATTGKWIANGTIFYLQDVSGGLPLTSINTLAVVTVNVASDGCVAITQQPASQTVGIGQQATFTVGATGAQPLNYQWQRNGINIPGANSTSYSISSVTSADNGAQFKCIVSNSYNAITSGIATLTITANITVASSPSGLQITYDGQPQVTPFSVASVVGTSHTLGVVSPQTVGGVTYEFDSWSDGGAASHAVTTPDSNTTYTAIYRVRGGSIGTGSGLFGTYFDNLNFTGASVTRIDPTIFFDWATGSPIAGINPGTFSVRWTGSVQAQFTENYTFYTQSSDGVRLWVNNKLLVDNWTDHPVTENSGTMRLKAGQKYSIRFEYYKNAGSATAKLLWSSQASTPKSVIPKSQLYPQ